MCEPGGCQVAPLDAPGKKASVWSGRGAGREGVMEAVELDSVLGGSLCWFCRVLPLGCGPTGESHVGMS